MSWKHNRNQWTFLRPRDNFRRGVFDTRICEFLFRTENYKLSFFLLLQKCLGHKSMEKINVACTQICFIFLFVLFENIGELASKAWEKKVKNVCRYLWEKRGLLSHLFMSTSHHYHLCVHGTNRIGPVELEIQIACVIGLSILQHFYMQRVKKQTLLRLLLCRKRRQMRSEAETNRHLGLLLDMWVLFIRKHWYCNIHCFDVMLIFPNWYSPCIPPWLKLFNVTIVNVLHSKYRYAIKFILKCTSHGGMYLEKLA